MIKRLARFFCSYLPLRSEFRLSVLLLFLHVCVMEFGAGQGQVFAAEVKLLLPQSGSTVYARMPETHLLLRREGSGETNRVRVEKSAIILEPIVSMDGEKYSYLHFRLPLEPGSNRYTILPGDQTIELNYQQIQAEFDPKTLAKEGAPLFHKDDALPKACEECHVLQVENQISCTNCHQNLINKYPWQHGPFANRQCLTCHQQSVKPWRIGFPTEKFQDLCLSCHTSKRIWTSRKVLHGPLSVGGCTLCHNPHAEKYRYQLWAEGSLTLCLTCHSDKQNLVSEKDRRPYVHGIIFGNGCVACHDPHATDVEYMLIKPINELCTSCHHGLFGVTKGHPVAGHPVTAPKDPNRPNRKLTCTSCHDPHGSDEQFFLIETRVGGRLCRGCHKR